MSSLSIYNSLMKHTVTLRKKDRNVSGDYSTLSETSLKGFVQFDTNFKIEKDGEMLEAKAIVFLKNDCGIDEKWPYYEIDQTAPRTFQGMTVFDIARVDDPIKNITHHFELAVR